MAKGVTKQGWCLLEKCLSEAMNVKKVFLRLSVSFNVIFLLTGLVLVHQKGGWRYIVNALTASEKAGLRWEEKIADHLPAVDGRVLFLGDSHLALQPWNEFTDLRYANRAAGGYKVQDVDILKIKGTPAAVVLSIGTNDLQDGYDLDDTVRNLRKLLQRIKGRWSDALCIYVSPPPPDAELYDREIRSRVPNIHRPSPVDLGVLADCAKSENFHVLYAHSAKVDGLHIDPQSAQKIAMEIENLEAEGGFSVRKR